MMQAAGAGAPTIPILRDDTDVFVLVYWVWKSNIHSTVQMEKWDSTILDINATVRALVEKCQGLMGKHVLSGCDTASCLWKGKGIFTETTGKCHTLLNLMPLTVTYNIQVLYIQVQVLTYTRG